MANEVNLGLAWLYTTLHGDATLLSFAPGDVRRGMAPPGTSPPFVVIAYQAGRDTLTMNGVRLLSRLLFQARVSGPAKSTAALVSAANRVDDLLKRTSGTTTGGRIDACYREEPLQFDELVNGEQWSNIGGLYRLIIEQA